MRSIRFAVACWIAWSLQGGVSFAMEDWLDKLSGPGKFREEFIGYRFVCLSHSRDQTDFGKVPVIDSRTNMPFVEAEGEVHVTWLTPLDRTATIVWARAPELVKPDVTTPDTLKAYRKRAAAIDCKRDQRLRGYAIVTLHRAVTDNNDLVAGTDDAKNVIIKGFDVGYVSRLSGAIDIGLAIGYNHFSGPAFGSFNKASITTSLDFAPFAIASDDPRAHLVKLTVGGKMFLGGFEASDFCKPEVARALNPAASCANTTWRSYGSYEIVPTIGVILDPSLFRK